MALARPNPGDILAGKYRVERLIGEGTVGLVVAAVHVELDQRVAIKFLRAEWAHESNAAERFRREARAAARIRSEHVARVLDVGALTGGETFIVMEYLEGNDLEGELALRGALPLTEALAVIVEVARGVAEAHACGIVHRDLKPANVFLVRHPDGSRSAKVLDFGISKSLDADSGTDVSLTQTSAVMGSPAYMSPEQLESPRDVDTRTDVWALGVILYEMLSGRPLHTGNTLAEICASLVHGTPAPLGALRADIPAHVEAAVARCLQKSRDLRFATAGEFVDALTGPASERQGEVSVLLSQSFPPTGRSSTPSGAASALARFGATTDVASAPAPFEAIPPPVGGSPTDAPASITLGSQGIQQPRSSAGSRIARWVGAGALLGALVAGILLLLSSGLSGSERAAGGSPSPVRNAGPPEAAGLAPAAPGVREPMVTPVPNAGPAPANGAHDVPGAVVTEPAVPAAPSSRATPRAASGHSPRAAGATLPAGSAAAPAARFSDTDRTTLGTEGIAEFGGRR